MQTSIDSMTFPRRDRIERAQVVLPSPGLRSSFIGHRLRSLDRPRIAGCGVGGSGGSVIGRWDEQSVAEELSPLSDPEVLFVRMLSQLDSRPNKVELFVELSYISRDSECSERGEESLGVCDVGPGRNWSEKALPGGWSRCRGGRRHLSR
jgi:hypothetical protein